MMRLTKNMKDALVRSVMADVPSVDLQQEANDLVLPAAIKRLPPAVKRVYDDSATRLFIRQAPLRSNLFHMLTVIIPCQSGTGYNVDDPVEAVGQDVWDKFNALALRMKNARKDTMDLQNKIRSELRFINTTKQLEAILPELVKYLPPLAQPVSNLPQTSNLIEDLKKIGWPKPSK